MEMKVFCTLTKEQASLYEAVVKETMETLDETEGIQRKGIVLATLSKLKQVCNHPAQFLGDNSPIPGRSGKLARLTEMVEEMMEVGDRALDLFSVCGDGRTSPEAFTGDIRTGGPLSSWRSSKETP